MTRIKSQKRSGAWESDSGRLVPADHRLGSRDGQACLPRVLVNVITVCVGNGETESRSQRRTNQDGRGHRRAALARAGYERKKQVCSRLPEALFEVL